MKFNSNRIFLRNNALFHIKKILLKLNLGKIFNYLKTYQKNFLNIKKLKKYYPLLKDLTKYFI
jgi:hypothetical protein